MMKMITKFTYIIFVLFFSVSVLSAELSKEKFDKKYPVSEKMKRQEVKKALRLAMTYQKKEKYEKAIKSFLSIPDKYPDYANARRRAGYNILGRELGRWQEAVYLLEDAYKKSPKNKKVLEDLGRAYIKVGNVEKAKEILELAGTDNALKALETLH